MLYSRHTLTFVQGAESSWSPIGAHFKAWLCAELVTLSGPRAGHVSHVTVTHLLCTILPVDGKVSPSTLSIGSALTLPSSLTSNSAAMLDLTSSLKAFMDGGEYLVYRSLLALCVCFRGIFCAEGVAEIRQGCSQVREGQDMRYLTRVTHFPTCSLAKAARPMEGFCLKLF